MVYNMLAWILTADEPVQETLVPRTDKVHRTALSLGQDFLHATSKGRLKTVKHVPLPVTVKNLTGQVNLSLC